jgi:hypothetical protein
MSLPAGLANRPAPAASHPAVVGGLWRVVLRAMLVLLPIVAHAAMQVPGNRWQIDGSELELQITHERHERRRLIAERAALLDPTRLRREARRLGLVPSVPESDTIELGRGAPGVSR